MNSKEISTFDWDKANSAHIARHDVTQEEAEEVFRDPQQITYQDVQHSTKNEQRAIIIGKTEQGRLLYQVFTIRKKKVRVISSRDMHKKKEVKFYEKTTNSS
jgi:uncharacterized protein